MILQTLIGIGILGSVVSMTVFSKYCRLLNRRWTLDPKEAELYQARAQRWLAATVCLIATAVVSLLLGAVVP